MKSSKNSVQLSKNIKKFFAFLKVSRIILNYFVRDVALTWDIMHKDKTITILSDIWWYIEMTRLGYYLDQKDVHSWLKENENEKISFQQYGDKIWMTVDSAVEVLKVWDPSLALKLNYIYKGYKFKKIRQGGKVFSFGKGSCIYCFTVGGVNKVGHSINLDERLKTHKSSVGRLRINWILFIKEARWLEYVVSDRFWYNRVAREHFDIASLEILNFIKKYCSEMGFEIQEVSKTDLEKYNNSFSLKF